MGTCDEPNPTTGSTPAIVCTLGSDGQASRVEEWKVALEQVTARTALPGGVELALGPAARLDEIARLAAAEQECCAFLAFTITIDPRGRVLTVTGPPDAGPIITELFGAA